MTSWVGGPLPIAQAQSMPLHLACVLARTGRRLRCREKNASGNVSDRNVKVDDTGAK